MVTKRMPPYPEGKAALIAALMLALALQKRADEIPALVVDGAQNLDDETFLFGLRIYVEMNDEEVASAFIAYLGLVSDMTKAIEDYAQYYRLGLDNPPDLSEDEINRSNENIETMVRAALPASERLELTDP